MFRRFALVAALFIFPGLIPARVNSAPAISAQTAFVAKASLPGSLNGEHGPNAFALRTILRAYKASSATIRKEQCK